VCVLAGYVAVMGEKRIDIRVLWGNLKVRHNLEDLSINGKIILEGY
jgi:hypothetical protein